MIKKTIALIAFTLSLNTNAALVDNGTYITDNIGGIDYLKTTVTFGSGNSYYDVVQNDSLGYIAQGWGLTSQTQIMALDSSDSSAYALINDLGGKVISNADGSGGQEFDFGGAGDMIKIDGWFGAANYIAGVALVDSSNTGFMDGGAAVMLSRVSPVPLPAAAWLFGSALLGLITVARRKQLKA